MELINEEKWIVVNRLNVHIPWKTSEMFYSEEVRYGNYYIRQRLCHGAESFSLWILSYLCLKSFEKEKNSFGK